MRAAEHMAHSSIDHFERCPKPFSATSTRDSVLFKSVLDRELVEALALVDGYHFHLEALTNREDVRT